MARAKSDDTRAADLVRVAKDLKLTGPQKAFAEALALDPKRNQTKAAEAAGVPTERAAIQGSRWVRHSKVRAYLTHLTAAATQVEVREARGTIANLEECLEYLTTVKRTRLQDVMGEHGELDLKKLKELPAGYVRKLKIRTTTDEDGQVYTTHEIEAESAKGCVDTMVRHYDGLDQPKAPGSGALTLVLMGNPALAAAVVKELLSRSGAPPRAIETTATVVR